MNRNKRGTGASEVIISVFVIVYVFLPLFSTIVQKAVLYHQTDRIKQTVEMAVISLITDNDVPSFSSGYLSINTDYETLKQKVFDELCLVSSAMLEIQKQNIEISIYQSGNICTCGYCNSHFMIATDISAVLDFFGKRPFSVHKHIEFPITK